MSSGVALGIVTAIMLITFVGIAIWAYRPARKDEFDRAARLPLADEDDKP